MSRSSELKVEKIQTGSGWKKNRPAPKRRNIYRLDASSWRTMFLMFIFKCYAFSKAGEMSTYRMLFFAALSSCVSVRKLE